MDLFFVALSSQNFSSYIYRGISSIEMVDASILLLQKKKLFATICSVLKEKKTIQLLLNIFASLLFMLQFTGIWGLFGLFEKNVLAGWV